MTYDLAQPKQQQQQQQQPPPTGSNPHPTDTSSPHPHNPLADDPPVAATQSGGPDLGPGLLVQPKKFQYENGAAHKTHEFGYMLERSFGMVDTSPERWHNLKRDIARLQTDAPEGVQYKVFFLGRHGEGWHNYSVTQIGVQPWEEYWAMQYSNPDLGLTWGPDPELTERGIAQAEAVQACWRQQAPLGAPISKEEMKWYVSPLTRTAQTMLFSWGDMLAGTPEVWEDWREVYGSHTCDKRRSRTYIAARFPEFQIDESVTEEDELWKEDIRETDEMMQIRGQRALDRVFSKGGAQETYISVTAHSGNLRNVLAVLGHKSYPLETGEMIPVVVKATAVQAPANGANGHGANGSNGSNGSNGHA